MSATPNPTPTPTRVYHVNRDHYDVYIGRHVWNRRDLQPLGWGNPYTGKDVYGENAVQAYRRWIAKQPRLLARLPELKGRRLGCWCAPKGGLDGDLNGRICHGQVLAALADALPEPEPFIDRCEHCGHEKGSWINQQDDDESGVPLGILCHCACHGTP